MTSTPAAPAVRTTPRITAFKPGQSPPLVKIAIRISSSSPPELCHRHVWFRYGLMPATLVARARSWLGASRKSRSHEPDQQCSSNREEGLAEGIRILLPPRAAVMATAHLGHSSPIVRAA